MNIIDAQSKRTFSTDLICFGHFRLSVTERILEKVASGFGLAASSRHSYRSRRTPGRSGQQEGVICESVARPCGR